MDVRGKGSHWGGEDTGEIHGNKFHGAVAGGDDCATRVVRFVGLREEVKCGGERCNNEGGGGVRETGGEDEIMDIGRHRLLVAGCGFRSLRAVGRDVLKLTESFGLVEVHTSQHHGSTCVGRFYNDTVAASETSEGRVFSWGDDNMSVNPGEVESVHNPLSDTRKENDRLELDKAWSPLEMVDGLRN